MYSLANWSIQGERYRVWNKRGGLFVIINRTNVKW
jgi:hypothetical protein